MQQREIANKSVNEEESIKKDVRVMLPFEDQKSVDSIRRQFCNLGKTIDREEYTTYPHKQKDCCRIFSCIETKQSFANQQCVRLHMPTLTQMH